MYSVALRNKIVTYCSKIWFSWTEHKETHSAITIVNDDEKILIKVMIVTVMIIITAIHHDIIIVIVIIIHTYIYIHTYFI